MKYWKPMPALLLSLLLSSHGICTAKQVVQEKAATPAIVQSTSPNISVNRDQAIGQIGNAIRNLDKATLDPVPTLPFDYGFSNGSGLLNTYSYLRSLMSFELLQSMMPMEIYLSGPHTGKELILNSQYQFGHYNPKFVEYFQGIIRELLKEKTFVTSTREMMIQYGLIEKLQRLQHIYKLINQNQKEFLEYKEKYQKMLSSKTLEEGDYRYELTPKRLDAEPYWNWAETDYNFWIRRSIDNTMPLWAGVIDSILEAYEPEAFKLEK